MRGRIVQHTIGAVVLGLLGWQIGSVSAGPQPRSAMLGIGTGVVLGLVFGWIVVGMPYRALQRLVVTRPASDLAAGFIGLIMGLVVAALLAVPLSFLPWWLGHMAPGIVALACVYLGVTLAYIRRHDLAQIHSRKRPEVAATPDAARPGYLVDTSAIIDGRIADVSQAGFLLGPLIVPRFVLSELQHIAGSSDALRRNRGRRGLEILNRMQKDATTTVTISDVDAREIPEVDAKLVKLARDMHFPVVTNDFNLNRVAELQGVRVLNINQLAQAVKPVLLPGEEMGVRIIQEGKEPHQGIGYLDDGTMIVVENGRRFMHNNIEIVVTRVLQTVAGRMIFAQAKGAGRE